MHRLTVVDSFTSAPFSGNPAAVCLLPETTDERWMQLVAREMSLAETAFLVPEEGEWRLRWFTPLVEVDLCGHATLAAAHVLWADNHLGPATQARFRTRSGLLTARREVDLIWLDFPSTPPRPVPAPDGLTAMLGAEPCWVGQTPFDYFVEVKDEATVRGLNPDLTAIARLGGRGMIVTAQSSSAKAADYISRFFAPAAGVPEDPVTGSAHCALAPYWTGKLGPDHLTGYQASARGGTVRTVLAGDRVMLGGNAVTVSRVELL
jgi:predicted PhzF superfamily epimerase YddE/YHI9